MNISKNWLNEYVRIDCPLSELCEKLTMAGIEVEGIENSKTVPEGVTTAKILSRDKHPDADKLSVCRVFDGKEELQIVCGAPNCDAGKIVPLAHIGTDFGGGFVIKKAKMRGVESFGMLCSAKELNLSEDSDGLLEFPAGTAVGVPAGSFLGGDSCIEIEVTPNRPDWLSHYGVARDVACLLGEEAHLPEVKLPAAQGKAKANLVTVEDNELCKRYIGQVIRNVKIKESPEWLKTRLESVGLRPINNVVDVTNFVLMELGQPLHAFDLAKLEEGRVVARRAKHGEKITTLDGKTLELKEHHLVICDAAKPMALAGIMGGEYSGVSETTTDILLESAVFLKSNIRSTSRELGISSDSSYRYERGVDFDMAEFAAKRAAQLILETAGGELEGEFTDVYAAKPAKAEILCRFDRVRSLIGIDLDNTGIIDIFRKLQLEVKDICGVSCLVTAPRFRSDLTREADLAEEVARIHGLDKVPAPNVTGKMVNSIADDAYMPMQQLRDKLIGLGLYECMHYSMVSAKSALSDGRFTESDLVKLDNPLSLDLAFMRPSMFGEMLSSLDRNVSRRNLNLRLFELGKAFCANDKLFAEERNTLAVMLCGQKRAERFSGELKELYDFYDLKGLLESLFESCRIGKVSFEPADDGRFKKGWSARVKLNGRVAGFFGEIAKNHTAGLRTNYPVFYAEIESDLILANSRPAGYYKALSQFPGTSRDVAFVADASLEHDRVISLITGAKVPDFESVKLFDIFCDEKMKQAGKKSMAYQVSFRNSERTLQDAEVNAAFEVIRRKLAEELNVELR